MEMTYVDKFTLSEEEMMEALTQQWTLPEKTAVRFPSPTASVTSPTVSRPPNLNPVVIFIAMTTKVA